LQKDRGSKRRVFVGTDFRKRVSRERFCGIRFQEEGCLYLKEVQVMALLCITMIAVLCDLRSGRIPNALIVTGLLCGFAYQILANGPAGFLLFLGGSGLPVLLFSVLFYFRMIGAGDIKLLCVPGAFLGPQHGLTCLIFAVLSGGLISLFLMIHHGNIYVRLQYFAEYVSSYSRDKIWRPYLDGIEESAKFCFSVPVLLGVLCDIGGII